MIRGKLWALVLGLLAVVHSGGATLGNGALAAEPPYPRSEYIKDFSLDWGSYRRLAEESDNWHMTWASDGRLYAPWGDGAGSASPASRSTGSASAWASWRAIPPRRCCGSTRSAG